MKGRWFCLLFVSLLLPAQEAGAQEVKLKVNLQFPISNPVFGVSLPRFKEEVERRSENGIAVEIFDKAQLFMSEQVIDAVSSGAVDIGITARHQFSDKAPLVAFLELPFLFNFNALMDAAARPDSEIRKLIDEAILAELGVRVLRWSPVGNNHFFSKGRDVADAGAPQGPERRVAGQAAGGVRCGVRRQPAARCPSRSSPTPTRTARSTWPCPASAPSQTSHLEDFADTVTFTHHTPISFSLSSTRRRGGRCRPTTAPSSPRPRSRWSPSCRRAGYVGGQGPALCQEARRESSCELTPDQVAEWRACSAGMVADYMAKNGEQARRLMAAYSKLRIDPCCTAGPSTGIFTRR